MKLGIWIIEFLESFIAETGPELTNYSFQISDADIVDNEEAKLICIKENYIIAVMVSQKTDLYNTSYTGGGPESSVYEYSEAIIGNIVDIEFQKNYGEKSTIKINYLFSSTCDTQCRLQ